MDLKSFPKVSPSYIVVILLVLAALLPRIVSLGTSLSIDEPLWLDRGAVFVGRIATFDIDRALPSIQPGVTTSWLTGIASPFNSLAASQASIGIASAVLVLIAAYFLISLLGKPWGVVASFLLALEPFLVAHGRVAHTDSLLTLFMLVSLLAAIQYGEYLISNKEKPLRYLVVSGVSLGLAILTKIFALALLPPLVAIFAYYHWYTRSLQRVIPKIIIFSGVLLLTLLFVWPTLITNFDGVLHQLTDGISDYAEGTRDGETTSTWWYYLREIYFRSSPITTILILPSIFLFFRTSSKNRRILGFVLTTGIFYALVLSLRGEKSDRYVLLAIVNLSIFSIIGLKYLFTWIGKEWNWNPQQIVLSAGVITIVLLGFFTGSTFPYPLAYYNPLYPIERTHKLGWGEGLEQAAVWLSENHPESPVSTYYPRVFSYFYTGNGAVDSLGHTSESETTYLVLYRSMFERGPDAPETEALNEYLFSNKKPLHVVSINNLPYAWIYEHPAP